MSAAVAFDTGPARFQRDEEMSMVGRNALAGTTGLGLVLSVLASCQDPFVTTPVGDPGGTSRNPPGNPARNPPAAPEPKPGPRRDRDSPPRRHPSAAHPARKGKSDAARNGQSDA